MKTTIKKGDTVEILPEWQDEGDAGYRWIAVSPASKGRVDISPIGLGLPIVPVQTVTVGMLRVVREDAAPYGADVLPDRLSVGDIIVNAIGTVRARVAGRSGRDQYGEPRYRLVGLKYGQTWGAWSRDELQALGAKLVKRAAPAEAPAMAMACREAAPVLLDVPPSFRPRPAHEAPRPQVEPHATLGELGGWREAKAKATDERRTLFDTARGSQQPNEQQERDYFERKGAR